MKYTTKNHHTIRKSPIKIIYFNLIIFARKWRNKNAHTQTVFECMNAEHFQMNRSANWIVTIKTTALVPTAIVWWKQLNKILKQFRLITNSFSQAYFPLVNKASNREFIFHANLINCNSREKKRRSFQDIEQNFFFWIGPVRVWMELIFDDGLNTTMDERQKNSQEAVTTFGETAVSWDVDQHFGDYYSMLIDAISIQSKNRVES